MASDLTSEILAFIQKCGEGRYTVRHTMCDQLNKPELNHLLATNKAFGCYQEQIDPDYVLCDEERNFDVLMFFYGAQLVGYIDYQHIPSHGGPILYIKYTCNDNAFRNKNISVLLRCLVFAEALEQGHAMIVSQTKEASQGLLTKKFGFTYEPDVNYDGPLGRIAMEIRKEFNCYYPLTAESKPVLAAKILENMHACKLPMAEGGRSRERSKRRNQRSKRKRSHSRK